MISEQQLIELGFVLHSDGIWRKEPRVPDRDTRQTPIVERHLGHGAVGEVQVQTGVGGRFFVRVKSFRKRLLDEDNLCEKYHCDLCRYAGILPSDAPGTAKIEVCQQKVGFKEREFVRIEIYKE